jgi:hypothetical protein
LELIEALGANMLTSTTSFADFTDSKVLLTSLDGTLFPSISTTIQVHKGFAEEQSKCDPVLSLYPCPFPDPNRLCVVVYYPTGPR